jgi:hypothetical protein
MSIFQYFIGLLLTALVFMAPLPLCLYILDLCGDKKETGGFSRRLLVLTVSWCVIETVLALILGICGCLKLWAVITGGIVLFVTGYALLKTRRLSPQQALRLPRDFAFSDAEKLILGVLIFTCLILLWINLTTPITEYDSLIYHLPGMAGWTQTGTFSFVSQKGHISCYPYGWEALCTLFMISFQGDFALALPNVIAWLIWGLSIYVLTRAMGVKRIYSMTSWGLAAALPMILENINTMHVDLPFAAFFITGLCFIYLYIQRQSVYYLVLFFAVTGMIMGIKTSGMVYGLLLIAILAAAMLKSIFLEKKRVNFSPTSFPGGIPFALGGLLSFLLTGGFWYIRNLIQVGNPLGPVNVKIAGIQLFKGGLTAKALYKTTLANLFDLSSPHHWNILLEKVGDQLGPSFVVMVLAVAAVLIGSLFFRGKHFRISLSTVASLMALLLITLLLYWATPYSGGNNSTGWKITPWIGQAIRYGLPFIGITAIIAAIGFNIAALRHTAAAVIVVIGSIFGILRLVESSGISLEILFLLALLLLLAWGIAGIAPDSLKKYHKTIARGLIPVLILASLLLWKQRQIKRETLFRGVTGFIENHIKPGDRIGYMYSHCIFLYYGPRFDHKVRPVRPRKKQSFQQWLSSIRKQGIRYIAIGPLILEKWKNTSHIKWLTGKQGLFVRVHGENFNKDTVIFFLKDENR